MSSTRPERRHQPRRSYVDVLFVSTLDHPKASFPCQTLDISAEGLRLLTDQPLEEGRPIQLWLRLAAEPGTFLLRGQVRWCQPSGERFVLGVAIDAEQGDGRDWKALLVPLAGIHLAADAD